MSTTLSNCAECGCLTRGPMCWTCRCLLDGTCVECGQPSRLTPASQLIQRRCQDCLAQPPFDGPVRGYRGWAVVGDQVHSLTSANDAAWIGPTKGSKACGEMTNDGVRWRTAGAHMAPAPNCGCGLRLVEDLTSMVEYWSEDGWVDTHIAFMHGENWRRFHRMHAIGAVVGSGYCYRGMFDDPARTWRCERLTLEGPIWLSPKASASKQRVALIAKRYRVEVIPSAGSHRDWLAGLHEQGRFRPIYPTPDLKRRHGPGEVELDWITDRIATGGYRGHVRPPTVRERMRQEHVDLIIDTRNEVDDRPGWATYPARFSDEPAYLRLPALDRPGHHLEPRHFDRAVAAARPVLRAGGKVFVHCFMGWNRGPSTALALLLDGGMTQDDALRAIRAARPGARVGYAADAVRAHQTRHQRESVDLALRPDWAHGHHGAAAAGALLVHDGEVLLTRRSVNVDEACTWTVPGGALEPAESAVDGALRELKEELNIDVDGLEHLGEHREPCPECAFTFTTHVFRASERPDLSRRLEAKHCWEVDRAVWFPADHVPQLHHLHPGLAGSWSALLAVLSHAARERP